MDTTVKDLSLTEIKTQEDKSAEERLKSVRTEFVGRVTEPTLHSLLDKLLQNKVISDEEMDTVRAERVRADKARRLIDMVWKRGNRACSKMIDMIHQVDPHLSELLKLTSELRLVLLGWNAAGRSAVGNIILGREEFAETSSSPQLSRRGDGEVCGRRLVLVDATALSARSPEEMRQSVILCLSMSAPGPHAFLLVLPAEASEEEVRETMEKMHEVFGESCWRHSIAIVVHEGSGREQGVQEILCENSIEQQRVQEVLKVGRKVQEVIEKCGNRFHVLHMKGISHAGQISQLLEKIESMVVGNTEISMVLGNTDIFYSTKIYHNTEAKVREMESKMVMPSTEIVYGTKIFLKADAEVRDMEVKVYTERDMRNLTESFEKAIEECTSRVDAVIKEQTEMSLEREQRREAERREEMERDSQARVEFERQMEEKSREMKSLREELERARMLEEEKEREIETLREELERARVLEEEKAREMETLRAELEGARVLLDEMLS